MSEAKSISAYRKRLMRLDKWHLDTVAFHLAEELNIKMPNEDSSKKIMSDWIIERELELIQLDHKTHEGL